MKINFLYSTRAKARFLASVLAFPPAAISHFRGGSLAPAANGRRLAAGPGGRGQHPPGRRLSPPCLQPQTWISLRDPAMEPPHAATLGIFSPLAPQGAVLQPWVMLERGKASPSLAFCLFHTWGSLGGTGHGAQPSWQRPTRSQSPLVTSLHPSLD